MAGRKRKAPSPASSASKRRRTEHEEADNSQEDEEASQELVDITGDDNESNEHHEVRRSTRTRASSQQATGTKTGTTTTTTATTTTPEKTAPVKKRNGSKTTTPEKTAPVRSPTIVLSPSTSVITATKATPPEKTKATTKRGGKKKSSSNAAEDKALLDELGLDFDPDDLLEELESTLAEPRARKAAIDSTKYRKQMEEISKQRRKIISDEDRVAMEEEAYKADSDEDNRDEVKRIKESNESIRALRSALGTSVTSLHVPLPRVITENTAFPHYTDAQLKEYMLIAEAATPWMTTSKSASGGVTLLPKLMFNIMCFHRDHRVADKAFAWLFRNMCGSEPVSSTIFFNTRRKEEAQVHIGGLDNWCLTFPRFRKKLANYGFDGPYLYYLDNAAEIGFDLAEAPYIDANDQLAINLETNDDQRGVINHNLALLVRLLEASLRYTQAAYSKNELLALTQLLCRMILDPMLTECLPSVRGALEVIVGKLRPQCPEADEIIKTMASPLVARHFCHWLTLISGLASVNQWQDQILTARLSFAALLRILEDGPMPMDRAKKEDGSFQPFIDCTDAKANPDTRLNGPGDFPSVMALSGFIKQLAKARYRDATTLTFIHVVATLIDRCLSKDASLYKDATTIKEVRLLANQIASLKTGSTAPNDYNIVAFSANQAFLQIDWFISLIIGGREDGF